jgi:hypothetical protein
MVYPAKQGITGNCSPKIHSVLNRLLEHTQTRSNEPQWSALYLARFLQIQRAETTERTDSPGKILVAYPSPSATPHHTAVLYSNHNRICTR